MRTIPAAMTPEMQKVYTQSTFLIWFQTVEATPVDFYMSTGGQVLWDSKTWLASGAMMNFPLSQDRVTFTMPNQAGAVLSLAADRKLQRALAKVYVMYPGGTSAEAVLFLNGVISRAANLFSDRASLSIDRFAGDHMVVPNTFIVPPGWNKLPPSNLEIKWNRSKIVLTKQEN